MDASAAESRSTRAALLKAAYERLATAGFEGLRTRDVAADAGVNIATLHYHFPTKEALIRAVVGFAMSRFVATLSGEGAGAEALSAHIRGLRRLLRDEPELPVVMGELALRSRRDPAIAEILQGADRAWQAWLVRQLGDDPRAAGKAAVVISTMRGLFMLPGLAEDRGRVDGALEALEVMVGLGGPSPTPPRSRGEG